MTINLEVLTDQEVKDLVTKQFGLKLELNKHEWQSEEAYRLRYEISQIRRAIDEDQDRKKRRRHQIYAVERIADLMRSAQTIDGHCIFGSDDSRKVAEAIYDLVVCREVR